MTNSKTKSIVMFVVVTLLWIVAILQGTLGFVRVRVNHDILVDSLHAIIWLIFLYSAWRLYNTFRAEHA